MPNSKDKILTLDALLAKVKEWKQAGDKIVFTNGCFDLIHLGHVDYLEKASSKGDRMVLGLNTDSSVRRLKGDARPVTDEYSRARVLASLQFIDAVILFDEDTPYELIRAVLPDILVKGNDYLAENIVGADIVMNNGGKVETVELVEGYSTTNIISRIKEL